MFLLASCKKCDLPLGMFNNDSELDEKIRDQPICWFCHSNLVSPLTNNLTNISIEKFQDSRTLINKSLEFWNCDNWEEKYLKWLDNKNIEISNRTQEQYITIRDQIKDKFKNSDFWIELGKQLNDFQYDYKQKNKRFNLFMKNPKLPELKTKDYDNFYLKTFRKNILENKNPFKEPDNGWILPDNWFYEIKDIVRTCFVVKYLDGVEYLASQINSLCNEFNINCIISYEAKEEGYYAAHLSILQEYDVIDIDWKTKRIEVWTEIQVTTQLQEIIRKLLHKYYEENREKLKKDDEKWQWNYKSHEFATNYLGHILHYVEGMIMEIRDSEGK